MRASTFALSGLTALLGLGVLVETALVGGGVGFVFGALLLFAGGLRLYLSRR